MSSGARMGKVELTSERHFLKIPRELHFWPWLNLFIAFIHFILTDTVETTTTETTTKTKNKQTTKTIGSISAVSRVRSLILPEERGMSAGSFSRTAAGNRAYKNKLTKNTVVLLHGTIVIFIVWSFIRHRYATEFWKCNLPTPYLCVDDLLFFSNGLSDCKSGCCWSWCWTVMHTIYSCLFWT